MWVTENLWRPRECDKTSRSKTGVRQTLPDDSMLYSILVMYSDVVGMPAWATEQSFPITGPPATSEERKSISHLLLLKGKPLATTSDSD